ncbi:hypothetical protein [Streptomyces fulvoviolaceus]|uniref:hypothetical protein n=1 Tax=Streptomyces fulvoviolaceus TaxID=285535 RepID=UPI0004CA7897|nr:hypothetical protein [Streptomyces fulvoviolaceus]
MTLPAALPGAALRVMRTAAGRRVLQVVLLVGGLFMLGFLCGEQAHAADGTVSATSVGDARSLTSNTVGSLVDKTVDADKADKPVVHPTHKAPAAPVGAQPPPVDVKPLSPVDDQLVRPVTDHVIQSVGDRVVQPVGEAVETVTTGLTEGLTEAGADLPSLPESPSWPSLPTLPELPGLPLFPVETLPAPVTSAPQPQPGGGAEPAAEEQGAEHLGKSSDTYGPRFVAYGTATDTTADTSAHRAAPSAYAPVHQAPADAPGGALGNRPAVDNGTSRHGDVHAVTTDHRAPLRLVPGAAAGVSAAGTRDRHRDIPVFPG